MGHAASLGEASTDPRPRFGTHMSVAGGLENAFQAGVDAGCDCLQIFVKNQRQWQAASLTDEQITRYREAAHATGLAPVVAHASYLLNLASPDASNRERSVRAMIDELERCEALGVSALIFHPGAALDDTLEAGIARIIESLDEVHRACPGLATTILLETTAGQGSAIGWHFDQLAAILDGVKASDRLGVCLDTCHLFAAGHDFRTADGYAKMIDEMDRAFGLTRVRCIHTNDSKKECGSRVDRHEHIGKGKIGKAGFAHFVNDPRFQDVPFILETPKGKDGRGTDLDRVNLKRLRGLLG
jgi:deoxyribonuclease IV